MSLRVVLKTLLAPVANEKLMGLCVSKNNHLNSVHITCILVNESAVCFDTQTLTASVELCSHIHANILSIKCSIHCTV